IKMSETNSIDSTTRIHNYESLMRLYKKVIERNNEPQEHNNGIYIRYKNPIITSEHAPVHWRYDLNANTNPYGLERIGINATFNAGAIKWEGKYILAVRVEGNDRKSFFAVAESPNGIDHFEFWDKPVVIPQLSEPDTNVYDMRLTEH